MRLVISPQILNVLLLIFLFSSNAYADAFKCIDKSGSIIFKDSACSDNEKQTLVELQTVASHPCNNQCDSRRTLCLDDLGEGTRNTSKNALLCEKVKEACYLKCANIKNGEKLEKFTTIERSSYERKLKQKLLSKNEALYKKEREKSRLKWEKKRKQRHCQRYKRKLAKIRAKWRKKQQKGWKPKDETYFLQRIENAELEVAIECKP